MIAADPMITDLAYSEEVAVGYPITDRTSL
jgi:hypothetical protein